jgi:hypothetical protein
MMETQMRAASLAIVLLIVALSGCSGGGSKADMGPSEDLSATHGAIEGLVTDDEALPIREAEIGVKAAKASPIQIRVLTSSEGRFRIENVPAGRQSVTASRPGYDDVSATVTVVPGETATVRLVMAAKALMEYKVVSLEPFKGQYTCAVEYFQASGECDFEVKNVTGQDPISGEEHNHSFMIPGGWGGLLFEVDWQFGADAGGIEGIRFQVESQEDYGGKFMKLEATEKPMKARVNQGEVAPDATLGYPIPARGVPTWINVLPLGTGDGALCPYYPACYGAGVAIQLTYTVHVTIFYGGPVDPEYTAIVK